MAESFQNCACFITASSDICCMTRVICASNAVADGFHSSSMVNSMAEPKFPMHAYLGQANAVQS